MTRKLKILTWNCKGAYRKKQKYLLDVYDPDIWIIQECEHPEKLTKEKGFACPPNFVWHGENSNRGIAVFSKEGYTLEISKNHNHNFRFVVPIIVSGKIKLDLFAIWAMNAKDEPRKQRYIGQVYSAFNYYDLTPTSTLILGDFNWNLQFDAKSNGLFGKFHDFLGQMDDVNFKSAYHQNNSEEFGKEKLPTLHLQNSANKPYHIDYIFGNNDLINKMTTLEVGLWEEWNHLSDHMPIYSEFEI